MKNIIINNEIAEAIFTMTGFNYNISSEDFGNGSEKLTFDSAEDFTKFVSLIPSVTIL